MFIVLEIQTDASGASSVLPAQTFADYNEAMSRFHTILAFAATSTVAHHTAVVMHYSGEIRAAECFDHIIEEPEA